MSKRKLRTDPIPAGDLAPTTTPDPDLAALVAELRALHKHAALHHALEVGLLLIDRLYDGELALYFDRDPAKHVRLRALLDAHGDDLDDIGLSATTLRACIVAVSVWRGLPDVVREALSLRRLLKLAVVKDPVERARLAHAAVTEAWTTAQLDAALQEHRQDARKVQPEVLRTVGHAARRLRVLDEVTVEDLDDRQVVKLLADVEVVIAQGLALKQRLLAKG